MFEKTKDYLDPPIREYRIFFFHIAKCGGTSIANAIVRCYKPRRLKNVRHIITLNENAARFAENNTLGQGNLVRRDLLNYVISLPEAECIAGHFYYITPAVFYRTSRSGITDAFCLEIALHLLRLSLDRT